MEETTCCRWIFIIYYLLLLLRYTHKQIDALFFQLHTQHLTFNNSVKTVGYVHFKPIYNSIVSLLSFIPLFIQVLLFFFFAFPSQTIFSYTISIKSKIYFNVHSSIPNVWCFAFVIPWEWSWLHNLRYAQIVWWIKMIDRNAINEIMLCNVSNSYWYL